jgi:hypothetical protein
LDRCCVCVCVCVCAGMALTVASFRGSPLQLAYDLLSSPRGKERDTKVAPLMEWCASPEAVEVCLLGACVAGACVVGACVVRAVYGRGRAQSCL